MRRQCSTSTGSRWFGRARRHGVRQYILGLCCICFCFNAPRSIYYRYPRAPSEGGTVSAQTAVQNGDNDETKPIGLLALPRDSLTDHNQTMAHADADAAASAKEESSSRWFILLTVNDGFYDFFLNWWVHYQNLEEAANRTISHQNLEEANRTTAVGVIVIADDDTVYAKLLSRLERGGLANANARVVEVERSSLQDESKAHSYGSKQYRSLVSTRATHILKQLRAGRDVLYVDLDSVFLKDPLPVLDGESPEDEVDLWIQSGSGADFCTGLMAFRSNERTVGLVERWEDALMKENQLNQPIFNRILRNDSSGVRTVGLAKELFPNGKMYFGTKGWDRGKAVFVHNNWISGHGKKKLRFQKEGLWKISDNDTVA